MTTQHSEQLTATTASGIEITYETFGDPAAEPLLLIMGLGGPLTWWDPGFCAELAEVGFFVIRYDNRDAGRSSRATGRVTLKKLLMARAGLPVKTPYGIGDLAEDAVGLLDALGIASAHLVGMSMGGMIAQTVAIAHPERVRSLTSIMSTTGAQTVGWQHPSIIPAILAPSSGEAAYIKSSQRIWGLIQSPAYPNTPEVIAKRAHDTWEYGTTASGTGRQLLAVLTQPNRTKALHAITAPTLVIHGLADKMVHVSGGRATSMAIPGSELLLIKGMGHDLPQPLWPTFVAAIRRNAERAAPHPRKGS